jgi:hypothetical protein
MPTTPPNPLDYQKKLGPGDDKIADEIIREMKIAIYVSESTIKVTTYPKGKQTDIEVQGSTVANAMQLFDRIVTQSLRDGPLHELLTRGANR